MTDRVKHTDTSGLRSSMSSPDLMVEVPAGTDMKEAMTVIKAACPPGTQFKVSRDASGLRSSVSSTVMHFDQLNTDFAVNGFTTKLDTLTPDQRQTALNTLQCRFLNKTRPTPFSLSRERHSDDELADTLRQFHRISPENRAKLGIPDHAMQSPNAYRLWIDTLTDETYSALMTRLNLVIADLQHKRANTRVEVESITRLKTLYEEFEDVFNKPVLQRCESSAFHKLMTEFKNDTLLIPLRGYDEAAADEVTALYRSAAAALNQPDIQVFLIQHDWAAAFDRAEDFKGGEFCLPFMNCAFEFRYSGKRFIIHVMTGDETYTPSTVMTYMESSGGWALLITAAYQNSQLSMIGRCSDSVFETEFTDSMIKQVKAISVALEAKVAVTEVTRAPHKLNAKRERAGKLPLYDYHVVDLSRRHHVAPRLPEPGDIEQDRRRSPRFHFRRGHYVHFTNFKTWRKWCLVGDPDLGFVDKEYRL